jgi:hypothetical protein
VAPQVRPEAAAAVSGSPGQLADAYSSLGDNPPIVGPHDFGFAGGKFADASSGDFVGIQTAILIFVPIGYISASPLSETSTYADSSFASLLMIPGSYVWSWGTGVHADTFTINIGASPVPEASTWAMMLLGFAGLGCAARRRKQAVRAISAW